MPELSRWRVRPPLGLYGRAAVVLVLAWTAGYVDAVGYLELAHLYTSQWLATFRWVAPDGRLWAGFDWRQRAPALLVALPSCLDMTGNTADLGRALSRAPWPDVLKHGWPILAFVLGLILGAAITEADRRRRFHSRLSLVLGLEMILLAVLVIGTAAGSAAGARLGWVGLPALAMGLQTVTVTRIDDQRAYSTYVTGSLSKFAEVLTGYGFWLANRCGEHRRSKRRHGLAAEWWPIAVLGALIAVDLARPIAAVAENEPIGFQS
ncbi:MAG TPA: YoaK family protein [Terriglobales bacterium]|nr:YoaK family protein [Terriglobales bacterium]